MNNVGYATLSIIPSAKGFLPALQGQTNPALMAAGSAGGAKMGKAARTSFLAPLKGVVGPMLTVMGLAKIGSFLSGAVDEASDLGESVNAVNVVFGDAARDVLKLGENAKTAVGLSNVQFNGLAVQFSAFSKTIAGEGGDVAGLLNDLTTRAADFASVMNVEVSDAAGLFQSGLAGETEPLRRYGIDLSAAAVQAHAYAAGIAKQGEELTEAQKVQARYSLLMQQTAQTQGDFANTSDSVANRQRIMAARWADLKAKIGTGLLPVKERLLGVLSTLLDRVEPLVDALGGPLGRAIDTVTAAFAGLGGNGGGPMKGILDFFMGLVPVVQAFGRDLMATLVPGIQSVVAVFREHFLPALNAILPVLQPVVRFILQTLGSAVIGALKGAFAFIRGVLKAISGLFNMIASLVKGDWEGLWNGVKQFAAGIWEAIKGAFQFFWNFGILGAFKKGIVRLLTSWKGGLNAVKGAGTSILNAIKGVFSGGIRGIISTVLALPRALAGATSGAGRWLLNVGKNAIRGFISGIRSMASTVISAIRNTITDRLPDFVKRALGINSPSRVFMALGAHTADGFAEGVRAGQRKAQRAMQGVVAPPDVSPFAAGSTSSTTAGGPLVGALTLQSSGDVRKDLDETFFHLRRIRRGANAYA